MSRAALLVGGLTLTACDLRAAVEDYQRRYCPEACDAGRCPADCLSPRDAGLDTAFDAGADGGGDAGHLPAERWTFHVLRFEAVTSSAIVPVHAFLDERDIATGALVSSDDLGARGVSWPNTSFYEALLSRADDGRGLSLVGYRVDAGATMEATDATARLVGHVTRAATDWTTAITDAWLGSNVYSAATVNGARFWVGGSSAAGNGGVRTVTRGSAGTTQAIDGGAAARFIVVRDGRLFTSGAGSPAGAVYDWGLASAPTSTPVSLALAVNQPVGFELLDRRADVPGLDTLYVAQSSGPAGLAKFVSFDGGWAKAWETSAATVIGESPVCAGLAVRTDGGAVTILCTRGAGGDAVVRFDDESELDGGAPKPRLVFRASGADVLRGVGILPE